MLTPCNPEVFSAELDCASDLYLLLRSCLEFVLNETMVVGQIKVQQNERGLKFKGSSC